MRFSASTHVVSPDATVRLVRRLIPDFIFTSLLSYYKLNLEVCMQAINKQLNPTATNARSSFEHAVRFLAKLCLPLLVIVPGLAAADSNYLNASMLMSPPKGAQQICQTYQWACASQVTKSLPSTEELELVSKINISVNALTREVSDRAQYSRAEFWALPTSAGGDCEDFALLKKMELVRRGIDPRKLLLATVLDQRRVPHAILVYRSTQGDLLLDNLTDKMVNWHQSGYIFLRMQDPQSPTRWVGGFQSS